MNYFALGSFAMSVDEFGRNYINSNERKERRIAAKRGLLLTRQGRKRK